MVKLILNKKINFFFAQCKTVPQSPYENIPNEKKLFENILCGLYDFAI